MKCTFSRAFYYMSLGVLSMGALPPGSPHGASVKREMLPSKAFPDMSRRVPSKDTSPPGSYYEAPYIEKDVPFPEPSFTYLYKSPAKEPPFQVPLAELPQKETLCFQSLLLPVPQSPR
jgi:hypothetical protein